MKTSSDALAAIPHRPPFLFIDDVVELTPEHIVAKKHVNPAADYLAGHYPGNPMMPGVLLCECAFQAGAVLMMNRRGEDNSESKAQDPRRGVPVLTRIRDAKFRHVVRPGDTLGIEVTFDEQVDNAYCMTGRVSVQELLALRVEFVCMWMDAESQV